MGKTGIFRAISMAAMAVSLTAVGVQAQVAWQTTHTTVEGGFSSGECGLENSALRVSIFPAYLDVEEDAEISALGIPEPGNDAKTLEITGTFSMPAGTAIIGALLWDGDKVLQGKLLDRQTADSLYEKIVDRNSTPPARPRDPLILELVSKDTYRFRIYPVAAGHSRHLRLRYQLPPAIGQDGIEMVLRGAIVQLFQGSGTQVSTTFQGGGSVDKAMMVNSQGLKTQMTLPRTRLMQPSELSPGYSWNGWYYTPPLRILPVDPVRQLMLKTSFPDGQMAGNYMNLYAGVTDEVLGGLKPKTEVVVFWKWHNPAFWIGTGMYGQEDMSSVYEAQNQAGSILEMYNQVGNLGIRLGLLHDDSKNAPRAFKVSGQKDPEYAAAVSYLRGLQGSYAENFARGLKQVKIAKPGIAAVSAASKNRFLSNIRVIKTLYSPDAGVVRHLIMVTAGQDYAQADSGLQYAFDSLFYKDSLSVGSLPGYGFSQAGFNAWEASQTHGFHVPTSYTSWGELPALGPMNLNVVVRNARKSYDFSIACSGGAAENCGSLTFHGKSDAAWEDSLEWEAFDQTGAPIGKVKTRPTVIDNPKDTAIALLWAGSGSAFSEKKELPLGPVYGFVDRWASLLSLQKDSLKGDFNDSGVPRIANTRLSDVIPNYDGSYRPEGGTAVLERLEGLGDPASWRVERLRQGLLTVRIAGLARGTAAELEVFDLMGKRAGYWTPRSGDGSFTVDAASLKSGVYVLKIRVAGLQAVKRIAL
jgi:hypothetical protein